MKHLEEFNEYLVSKQNQNEVTAEKIVELLKWHQMLEQLKKENGK